MIETGSGSPVDMRELFVGRPLPVEVHCHGFGDVDFSELDSFDLDRLDAWCAREGVLCVPTMYLHRAQLTNLERFAKRFHAFRQEGELPHLVGFALEGPLLSSHGGTPEATVWLPEKIEWERLAMLGQYGMRYIVMSPDAFAPASEQIDAVAAGTDVARFEWIIPTLLSQGVRPALGHFTKADPEGSAAVLDEVVELAWSCAFGGTGARIVTDHLFNDMPLRIRHAFRTTRARRERDSILASYDLPGWELSTMAEIAGVVPAAIMRHAAAGRLSACMNFDNEHVDIAIAARAAQLMGPRNTMMMTDRCDSARLGGQELVRGDENGLWYQGAGVVAAGSVPLAQQVAHALGQRLPVYDVYELAGGTAHRAFGLA